MPPPVPSARSRTSHATAALCVSAVNRPTWSSDSASGKTPAVLTCPNAGLSPTTPQCAAGVRTLQPVSVPSASGTYPAATAAAEPDDEPPVIRVGSCGLRAGPVAETSPVGPCANSWVCSFATTTAPAARNRATAGASAAAGGASASTFEPQRVGSPATSMRSFTPRATPCSGPRHRPCASSSVSAAAAASAPSRSRVTTALYGSAARRSRASVTCSVGDSSPRADGHAEGAEVGHGAILPCGA